MASHTDESRGALSSHTFVEDMDERLARLFQMQQLQQKQEVNQLMESHTVTNADTEFRRGLEELVRDHLNTCMVLASCSSTHDSGVGSSSNVAPHASAFNEDRDDINHVEHGSNHMLHQYHDYLVEPSSHQTDVQSFQNEETVFTSDNDLTDEEHDNSGELVQSPGGRDRGDGEHSPLEQQPRSRVLSIWAAQRAEEMITTMERQARQAELLALAGRHTVSTLDASFLRESPARTEQVSQHEERPRRRASIVQMWRELEEEQRNARDRTELEEMIRFGNSANSEVIQAHNVGQVLEDEDGIVERGATTFTEESRPVENAEYVSWNVPGAQEQVGASDTAGNSRLQNQEGDRERVRQIIQRLMTDNEIRGLSSVGRAQHRAAWLDENERERVRGLAREWVRVVDEQRAGVSTRRASSGGSQMQVGEESTDAVDGGFLNRSQQRYRNQQAILDLLMRVEQERQRELQVLLEHRAVSDFAHRHRLQSLLRGRFLRTGGVNEEERPPSSAAGELGQLRQRRAVSGIREGFRFRLEAVLRNQANNREDTNHTNVRVVSQQGRVENQQVVRPSRGDNRITRDIPINGMSRGGQRTFTTNRRPRTHFLAGPSTNVELQELLGRRSVTNVLTSDFRDRLDQLIRSFLNTQGHTPVTWDVVRNDREPQQQQPQRPQQVQRAAFPPPPPPPPLQPLWQQDMLQGAWPRSSHRSSYMESDSMNELRTDISKLQQGMSDLRRIMETCMEMQLDLQRSVRQELAGALQRLYDGKAVPEEAIDGSRCGHMCTCLKCASELMKNSGKCPMCRAPIVEVVRAFTVT